MTHENADDVLQNTFLKAWRNLDDFRGGSKLSTWLYRIAVNESLDYLRKEKTRAQQADSPLSLADRLSSDPYFDGDRALCLWAGSANICCISDSPGRETIDIGNKQLRGICRR